MIAADSSPPSVARDIIMRHGWNSVAYQILNPGFQLWFSSQGDAVAGYIISSSRWVVGGAPVCAPDRLPRVLEEMEAEARASGCRVCYFGASARMYEGCKNPPRHCIVQLGAQPVWQPSGWQHIIANRASLRAQLNRALNKGVTVAEWSSPSPGQIAQLRQVLSHWLNSRPMPPMHFLVEPDTLGRISDRRILVALRNGAPCGYLVASPVPARQGWLIEQIIRQPGTPNGTNELLLHEAMTRFAAEKCQYVTLGLVPLASYQPPIIRNPLWLRLLFRWSRAHGRRFYNFQGLESFKAKFNPHQWEPIYAIATEPRFTPRTLWAIAAAFSQNHSPLVHGIRSLTKAGSIEITRIVSRLRSGRHE